jgi:hypothetical protein
LELWAPFPITAGSGERAVVVHPGGGNAWMKIQLKTGYEIKAQEGIYAKLSTRNGRDAEGQIESNLYTKGDADVYIVVVPPEAAWGDKSAARRTDFWFLPEARLIEDKYVRATEDAPDALTNICVYRPGESKMKHKTDWTKAFFYRSR